MEWTLTEVLLAYRARLPREALRAVLSTADDLRVVALVADGGELAAAARQHRPAVVVLDSALPGAVSVPELCRALLAANPAGRVLVVLEPAPAVTPGVELARLAPAVGLVTTEATPGELADAIRSLAAGRPVLDVEVAVAALTANGNPLTERERDVLRLARDGVPTREMARRLFLSTGTVRNYLSRATLKVGARTRIEAIRAAQDAGWI